ncbi:37177_t:CDS:2, partial [Gigaspora margarita]
ANNFKELHELGVKLRKEVAEKGSVWKMKTVAKRKGLMKSKIVKAGSSDKDITDLQKKVSDLTNEKDNLDKELKQKQQQILDHKCDTPNSNELNQLKDDLKKANEEKEELERKLNNPNPNIPDIPDEEDKDLGVEELRTKLSERNKIIGQLKARLEKVEKNNSNTTQNPKKTGTTALVLIGDDKPFKVKTLNEKGEEVLIETYFYFLDIKNKEWKEHLNGIIRRVRNFKPDVIVFEETDFIKMLGIKADQVKILRRQICSGVKISEKYTNHKVYSHLPSEVKHLTFKDGRGGGYFFTHTDGRKEKITVHQADAYL